MTPNMKVVDALDVLAADPADVLSVVGEAGIVVLAIGDSAAAYRAEPSQRPGTASPPAARRR